MVLAQVKLQELNMSEQQLAITNSNEDILNAIEKYRQQHAYEYNKQYPNKLNIFEAPQFKLTKGKKYIKLITQGSAHCFIILKDDGKFQRGDILKPASWNAPTKNFSRGNILTGYFINIFGINNLMYN